MKDLREIRTGLHDEILKKIDLSREVEDFEIEELISTVITEKGKTVYLSLSEKQRLKNELFDSIRKKGVIQPLIDDPRVTEIMVNGTENIFVEQSGRLFLWDRRFESREALHDVVQQIAASSNRVVNEASPIVDARLENGSRVNIVMNPVALNGPIITIRRFPDHPIRMDDLIRFGAVTPEAVDFLRRLVVSGYNIFISGGTGSGKTTFLNALSGFIPEETRVITIEDSAELQIQGIPNLVSLETRNANVEGCNPITIRDLIKSSLRMRPDRIVVGEVRDGAALDFLQAANTGHDGSMSTGHANSARDMLLRLEVMVLMAGMELPLTAIRRQIASAVDIIVHLGRLRDKSRKVLEITEILDYEDGEIRMRPVFQFDGTRLAKVNPLVHTEKLERSGLL
ncbi:pilus assembly protein CpaF [Lachnospiraceae bacterium]|nr:pilus assembly protein CpaF [Lachnospiraceae bacterium]